MKYITITNGKGGVANTSTAVTLAHWLALYGYETLIIDCDLQGDCAKHLSVDATDDLTVYLDGGDLRIAKTQIEKLCVVTGNGSLATLETSLRIRSGMRSGVLTDMAKRLRGAGDGFDVVVIDTSKSGLLRDAAVMAADAVIVPTKLDFASASNTIAMVGYIAGVAKGTPITVLPVAVDGRRKTKQLPVIAEIRNSVGADAAVSAVSIPQSSEIENAVHEGKTIWTYAPSSAAAVAYDAFAEALMVVANA